MSLSNTRGFVNRLVSLGGTVRIVRDFWILGLASLTVLGLLILGPFDNEIVTQLIYVAIGILAPLLWITGKKVRKGERWLFFSFVVVTIGAFAVYVNLPVKINVVGNSYGGLREELKQFNAANRDVEATLFEDWGADTSGNLYRKAVDYIGKGGAIDVIELDGIWMDSLIKSGNLLELDDFFVKDMGEHQFLGTALEMAKDEQSGHIYGIPLYVDVGLIFYRKDILGELPVPISIEELEHVVTESLDRRDLPGLAGFVFQGARYEGLNVILFEILMSENPDLFTRNDKINIGSEDVIKIVKRLHDLIYKSGIVPPSVLSFEEEGSRKMFAVGRALVLRNWPYVVLLSPASLQISTEDIGITSFRKPILGGWYLGITKHSDHSEAAWEVIKYLTSIQSFHNRATSSEITPRRVPPDMEVIAQLRNLFPVMRDVEQALGRARARPRMENYHIFSEMLSRTLFGILSDETATEATIREALKTLQADFE